MLIRFPRLMIVNGTGEEQSSIGIGDVELGLGSNFGVSLDTAEVFFNGLNIIDIESATDDGALGEGPNNTDLVTTIQPSPFELPLITSVGYTFAGNDVDETIVPGEGPKDTNNLNIETTLLFDNFTTVTSPTYPLPPTSNLGLPSFTETSTGEDFNNNPQGDVIPDDSSPVFDPATISVIGVGNGGHSDSGDITNLENVSLTNVEFIDTDSFSLDIVQAITDNIRYSHQIDAGDIGLVTNTFIQDVSFNVEPNIDFMSFDSGTLTSLPFNPTLSQSFQLTAYKIEEEVVGLNQWASIKTNVESSVPVLAVDDYVAMYGYGAVDNVSQGHIPIWKFEGSNVNSIEITYGEEKNAAAVSQTLSIIASNTEPVTGVNLLSYTELAVISPTDASISNDHILNLDIENSSVDGNQDFWIAIMLQDHHNGSDVITWPNLASNGYESRVQFRKFDILLRSPEFSVNEFPYETFTLPNWMERYIVPNRLNAVPTQGVSSFDYYFNITAAGTENREHLIYEFPSDSYVEDFEFSSIFSTSGISSAPTHNNIGHIGIIAYLADGSVLQMFYLNVVHSNTFRGIVANIQAPGEWFVNDTGNLTYFEQSIRDLSNDKFTIKRTNGVVEFLHNDVVVKTVSNTTDVDFFRVDMRSTTVSHLNMDGPFTGRIQHTTLSASTRYEQQQLSIEKTSYLVNNLFSFNTLTLPSFFRTTTNTGHTNYSVIGGNTHHVMDYNPGADDFYYLDDYPYDYTGDFTAMLQMSSSGINSSFTGGVYYTLFVTFSNSRRAAIGYIKTTGNGAPQGIVFTDADTLASERDDGAGVFTQYQFKDTDMVNDVFKISRVGSTVTFNYKGNDIGTISNSNNVTGVGINMSSGLAGTRSDHTVILEEFSMVGTEYIPQVLPTDDMLISSSSTIGTHDGVDLSLAGTSVLPNHSGDASELTDGNTANVVDTFNGNSGSTSHSFISSTWSSSISGYVHSIELTLALYMDGGWFGTRQVSPGAGNPLVYNTHITNDKVPKVQIKSSGASTWTDVDFTSDYTVQMSGVSIGGGSNPNPVVAPKVTFVLNTPVTNIDGIRLIGEEGGTASNGFVGVADWKVLGSNS